MTWQNKLLFVNEANLNSKASQLFIVMVSQLVTNKKQFNIPSRYKQNNIFNAFIGNARVSYKITI